MSVLSSQGSKYKVLVTTTNPNQGLKCRWLTQATLKEGSHGLKPANAAVVCVVLRYHFGTVVLLKWVSLSKGSRLMFLEKAKPTCSQKQQWAKK